MTKFTQIVLNFSLFFTGNGCRSASPHRSPRRSHPGVGISNFFFEINCCSSLSTLIFSLSTFANFWICFSCFYPMIIFHFLILLTLICSPSLQISRPPPPGILPKHCVLYQYFMATIIHVCFPGPNYLRNINPTFSDIVVYHCEEGFTNIPFPSWKPLSFDWNSSFICFFFIFKALVQFRVSSNLSCLPIDVLVVKFSITLF